MNLYEELKALEPLNIATHWDADGIYSAMILKKIFDVKEVKIPKVFGDYGFEDEQWKVANPTSKKQPPDASKVALDLGFPLNKEYRGIVIDHHPDHPADRKYSLYWDYCPTGLVLYKNLKDYIKKEDTWLVLGSLVGDAQAELCPDEIWEANPQLLEGRGTMYKIGFKVNVSDYPIYVTLSSGINSLCRLGFPDSAMDTLENFDNPIDLLESLTIRDASEAMRKEEDAVFKNKPIIESLSQWITLARIKTSKPEIKIGGIIGAKLSNINDKKTYIVINETSGDISIRGTFAKYICSKLNQFGYKAGGHAGFAGAQVNVDEIPEFIKKVRTIRL